MKCECLPVTVYKMVVVGVGVGVGVVVEYYSILKELIVTGA